MCLCAVFVSRPRHASDTGRSLAPAPIYPLSFIPRVRLSLSSVPLISMFAGKLLARISAGQVIPK